MLFVNFYICFFSQKKLFIFSSVYFFKTNFFRKETMQIFFNFISIIEILNFFSKFSKNLSLQIAYQACHLDILGWSYLLSIPFYLVCSIAHGLTYNIPIYKRKPYEIKNVEPNTKYYPYEMEDTRLYQFDKITDCV